MAYVPREFKNGEVLMAGQLNSMDAQIARNETAAANRDFIANNYDPLATYEKGDLAIYNGTVQVAIVDIPTPEVFTSSHWKLTTMNEQLNGLKTETSFLKSAFAQLDANVITESAGPSTIVSIADGADGMPMRKVEVAIEPVQDLHGYEYPWPAGGGKNLLPLPATGGTINGLTFTINTDSGNNPVSATVSGTASATTKFFLAEALSLTDGASYALSGCPSGGGSSKYMIQVYDSSDTAVATDGGSGAIFTFASGYKVAIVVVSGQTLNNVFFEPMIRLSSEADATFSPYSNVCPISGWTGAKVTRTGINIWDEEWELGNISPTTGTNASSTERIRSIAYIAVRPSTGYYFKAPSSLGLRYYDANKNFIGSATVRNNANTMPDNCFYLRFVGVDITTYGHDISINYPSTDHDYHPGHAQTYEVTFPADPGTVYGGTLDVASGKLVVDRACQTYDGSSDETWRYYAIDNGNLFRIAVPDRQSVSINVNAPNIAEFKCNSYKPALDNGAGRATGTISGTSTNVDFVNNSYATVADWRTYLAENNVQFCYPLANPQEITLTPTEIKTLLGINNVWADVGNTSITYPADAKTYIDNRINSTRRLIAGIETGFTASKLYAIGDMLIIGDDLYKVTAQIASGATITVGTNVNKTTVAEQLIALANA